MISLLRGSKLISNLTTGRYNPPVQVFEGRSSLELLAIISSGVVSSQYSTAEAC